MWIYIVNYLTIPIYSKIKNKKIFIALVTLQLFLILAFRADNIGVDLGAYRSGFEYISSFSYEEMLGRLRFFDAAVLMYPFDFESGYVVINWIISSLGGSFHTLLVLHAAFCMISFGAFVYRYSDDPWLSFCMILSLDFFTYTFGILRQTLAMCILLWAVPAIQKRKFFRFLLILLVAFTIHRVSLIFLPLYFLARIRMTKKRYLIFAEVCIVLMIITPFLKDMVLVPILSFVEKSEYLGNFSWNNQITLMILLMILVYIFADFSSFFVDNPQNSMICWGFLLAIPVEIIGLFSDVFSRSMQLYYIFIVALVPNVIARYTNRKVAFWGKGIMAALLLAFMIYQLQGSKIVPYETIF